MHPKDAPRAPRSRAPRRRRCAGVHLLLVGSLLLGAAARTSLSRCCSGDADLLVANRGLNLTTDAAGLALRRGTAPAGLNGLHRRPRIVHEHRDRDGAPSWHNPANCTAVEGPSLSNA